MFVVYSCRQFQTPIVCRPPRSRQVHRTPPSLCRVKILAHQTILQYSLLSRIKFEIYISRALLNLYIFNQYLTSLYFSVDNSCIFHYQAVVYFQIDFNAVRSLYITLYHSHARFEEINILLNSEIPILQEIKLPYLHQALALRKTFLKKRRTV